MEQVIVINTINIQMLEEATMNLPSQAAAGRTGWKRVLKSLDISSDEASSLVLQTMVCAHVHMHT